MIHYVGYGDRYLQGDPGPYPRAHHELLILLEGRCGLVKAGHALHMEKQSAWLMPQGSRHAWKGDGDRCRLLSVMLDQVDVTLRDGLRATGGLHVFTSKKQRKLFGEIGGRIYNYRDDFWQLHYLSQIVQGEVGLLFRGRCGGKAPADWRVDHALAWFEEHMHLAPKSDDLADAVGCSSAHLRRLFQAAGQAPIADRLDERRLARATSMLLEGRWSTAYIARQCGWGSAGALTHAMRRRFGCNVREWLKQHGHRSP